MTYIVMSPSERQRSQRDSKFTRGEKCIFTHIVVTFLLIIILVIIYFIHLCFISHKGNDMFKLTRRQLTSMEESKLDYKGLGLAFLKKPIRALCNTLLVQTRWSIAPGFCVAARAEPHLSELLPFWTIKYKTGGELYTESGIIRSITHPHFNIDDLDNNIGLFEHEAFSTLPIFKFSTSRAISLEDEYIPDDLSIESWDFISKQQVMHNDVITRIPIKGPLSSDDCRMYVSPITDLRGQEFCVVMGKEHNVVLVHGALLLYTNSNVLGFFSWGLKQSGVSPKVILNITYFRDWVEYITS